MDNPVDISMEKRVLRVGHSPDPDDAFMFYALSKGEVRLDGYQIEHVIEDIQSLNRRALNKDLEITAISAAIYPFIAEDYWILSCGASVGRNYGPIVVSSKTLSKSDLKGKKIAVPGLQTTSYLLSKIFLDDFEPVEVDFTDVIPAVKNGDVDAGIVIHEGQLNYGSFGLHKCLDLGSLWFEKTSLPIPLGLDIVRKDMGIERAKKINQALTGSIRFARCHENEALAYALKFGRGMSKEAAKQFVGMYVNDDTLDLGNEGKAALETLFRYGVEKGVYRSKPEIEIISG